MEAKSRGSVAPNRSRSERRSPESWQELTQRRIPAQLQQTCKRNEQGIHWLRLPGTLHSMSFSREEEMDRTQTKGMDVISYGWTFSNYSGHTIYREHDFEWYLSEVICFVYHYHYQIMLTGFMVNSGNILVVNVVVHLILTMGQL